MTKTDDYASVAGDWDDNTIIDINAATAKTITIPATAFAGVAVGTKLRVQWTWGAVGTPVIAGGAGCTITGTKVFAAEGEIITLVKTAAGALRVI